MILGIFLSLMLVSSNGLTTSKSPGGNFDLSHFYLTLPDDDVSTISAEELEGGYEGQYFYTDSSDGAMTFYVPSDGGTTSGSSYPRSELREQCNPPSNDYNWDLTSGTHQINGQYEIDSSTTATYFIIQQIHTKNGPGKPLLKIRYTDGYIRVELKTDEDGKDEVKTVAGYVGKGTKFWVKIIVKDGYVKTYLDGTRITNDYVADYWGEPYLNYFKTGCYKTQKESENVKAYVKVYSLTRYHSDASLCKDVDDAFILSDNESTGNVVGETIAVIVIVLFVLGLCGFAGYCFYKKKYLPSKGQATFKDDSDDNNKENGDTPIVNNNEDGGDSVNQTQTGYDMDEIEVDVEVNN